MNAKLTSYEKAGIEARLQVAKAFGLSNPMNTQTAYFGRFSLDLTDEAVTDCSHQGQCDDDVAYWSQKIARPSEITVEALRAELKEYGAWDSSELSDDNQNWHRLIWIAAGNIKEESKSQT